MGARVTKIRGNPCRGSAPDGAYFMTKLVANKYIEGF